MNSAIKKEEEKNYNDLKKTQLYQYLKKILSSILLFQVSNNKTAISKKIEFFFEFWSAMKCFCCKDT